MIVDLNADVGEGADDLPIFPLVTSVSIACGAHAGDEATMERCVAEAKRLGVSIGAHPGYPDRAGFGRDPISIEPAALRATLVEQLRTLDAVCRNQGARLRHVKPHGALYNQAAVDPALAATIVAAMRDADPSLALVALAGSAMIDAARAGGVTAFAEAFADRRYAPDGTLAPRGTPGALIEDPATAAAQALAIARGEPITATDGSTIVVDARSICLHADTPGALAIATAVRRTLEDAGIEVAPPSPR
jgi:5-oxoprolinase (ATP-hydrolysing) subunit A